MNALAALPSLLKSPTRLRVVSPDIYSILLPSDGRQHLYDRRAVHYDRVVGTWLYNRFVWGNAPQDYSDFARSALSEGDDRWLLDAGGGSLLFTAHLHLQTQSRCILVLDQSLEMLMRARTRLIAQAGAVPEHIALLQGDLRDLHAFVASSIGTVLCLNVLHHIEAGSALISDLADLLDTDHGLMYTTSLIRTGRISDLYLCALYLTGGFVRPRTAVEIRQLFDSAMVRQVTVQVKGNMAYVTATRAAEQPDAAEP